MKSLAALETVVGALAVLIGLQMGAVLTGAGAAVLVLAAGLWFVAVREVHGMDDDPATQLDLFRELA